MTRPGEFTISPAWRLVLVDLGIRPANVLRRAGLPGDLLTRSRMSLPTAAYFRLWEALAAEADDPELPIKIGRSIPVEGFDAPLFAALCSPDLLTAVRRLSHFKRLFGPMALHVEDNGEAVVVEIEWLDKTVRPPAALVAMELVFFVALARLGTRAEVHPMRLTTPSPPLPAESYAAYFGATVESGPGHAVTFSAEDARRPFLTANEAMWRFFEPELRRRLSELDERAAASDRVRAALLELLPSGRTSIGAVSKALGVSPRTLQRQLAAEGKSFQRVLDATRADLARHYLGKSTLSGAEISLLLGYEDPSSFSRAFHAWTGQTPESARSSLRATI